MALALDLLFLALVILTLLYPAWVYLMTPSAFRAARFPPRSLINLFARAGIVACFLGWTRLGVVHFFGV